MNEHICERCGYKTSNISNFRKHLQKKIMCRAKLSDINIEELRVKYIPIQKDKTIKCKCGKVYTTKNGLYLHQRSNKCEQQSVNNDNKKINLCEEIELLKKEIECLKSCQNKTIINNTSNTSNITNTVNISVHNFGNENTSFLTQEFLSYCLLNPRKGMTSLIENIHYNKDYPENHNIRCKSLKQNVFEKYIDAEWRACDASNTLDELIRKGYRILNTHYTERYMNDPNIYEDEMKQRAYERFRFLGDTSCNDYFAIKRELRILVKDRTMYLLESPTIEL
jgi:hypothetical protein